MTGSFLDVAQWHAGVEGGGDERVSQCERPDSFDDPGLASDATHDTRRAVTVESPTELARLASIAASSGRVVPVMLRAAVTEHARLERVRLVGDDGAGKFGMDTADLLDAALQVAAAVEESAPLAVAAVLEVTRETQAMPVDEAFGVLRDGDLPAYRAMLASDDALEGPRAFAEKRAPKWTGR